MVTKTWAVVGAGNGGHAFAGHLALLGQRVRIFDVVQATVDALNEKGGITLEQELEGFGPLEFATTDIEKVMDGAEVIALILPSIYHEAMARRMIPHLKDGQTVFIQPEQTCGGIMFRKLMKEMGCTADVVIGTSVTLLYAARLLEPGHVRLHGLKKTLPIAAIPSKDNARLEAALCDVFPMMYTVQNVLMTSLRNLNIPAHPLPTLMNTSRLEADPYVPFEYYLDGITPSIGKYLEHMDEECIAVSKAFGCEIPSLGKIYSEIYDYEAEGIPLHELYYKCPGYAGIMGGKTLRARYILEDIPYSLVPAQALARIAGVPTPYIDVVIALAYNMLPGEIDEGRTAEALGIAGMTKEELLELVNG